MNPYYRYYKTHLFSFVNFILGVGCEPSTILAFLQNQSLCLSKTQKDDTPYGNDISPRGVSPAANIFARSDVERAHVGFARKMRTPIRVASLHESARLRRAHQK